MKFELASTTVKGYFVFEMKGKFATKNGMKVAYRRASYEDIPLIKGFLAECSDRTLYLRYGEIVEKIPTDDLDVSDDESGKKYTVIAESPDNRIIALAKYRVEADPEYAEFSIIVQDTWQCQGIGRAILDVLITAAAANGIKGFDAFVLSVNHGMIKLLHHLPYQLESSLEGESYLYRFCFNKTRC